MSKVKDQNVFTIVGGANPTIFSENVINNENGNAICVGEVIWLGRYYINKVEEIIKLLNGYIKYLQTHKDGGLSR